MSFMWSSISAVFILILIFGRALRRQRLYTLADLFGQQYNNGDAIENGGEQ